MAKLVINTELNTDKFEKQLNDLEKKASNKEIDIDITSKELSDAENKLNSINDKLDERITRENEIKKKLEEANNEQYKSSSLITMYKEQLTSITNEQLKLYDEWDKQNLQVDKLTGKLEKQKNDLSEIQNKIKNAKTDQIQENINNISKGLKGIVKNVVRWGLAIFSIRSAYMLVRNAINTISQNDEQLKTDIDYMKNAIAYVLEPVVRKVVEWAKQLVFYIGYLIKMWTGHDIFASANKNLKKSVGSAKELNKQLAGFDEMNVISDTSGGAGGGGAMPSFNFEEMEAPDWLIKIKEIGEWIIANWEDVVGILLLTKLFIDILTGNWLGVIIDLVLLLIDLFFKFKDAIGEIAENWKEAFAIVADFMMNKVIKPIGEWFANLWQKIKDGVSSAVQWIKDKFNAIKDFFRNIIDTIVGFFKTIGSKVGEVIGGAFKAVINGVLGAIENILNFPIRSVNKLLDVINKVPGINISKLATFNLPRLAKGGIINMPGRGVPVGSAIGGERGQEGVIPLTDSQQMALLGEAIGKYVTINATVPVYVGNRMVARELKRINAEDNFAFNR